MADQIIDNSKKVSQSVTNIETQVKNSVKNINVDLSKIDASVAADSFKKLTEVLKNASFGNFIDNMVSLEEVFTSFQKKVSSATGSVTKFAGAVPAPIKDSVVAANVEVELGDLDVAAAAGAVENSFENMAGVAAETSGRISSDITASAGSIGSAAGNIGSAFAAMGGAALDFGSGVASAGAGISSVIDSVTGLLNGVSQLGAGLTGIAAGCAATAAVLPQVGTAMLQMAVNMAGITEYLGDLLVFVGIMVVLGLLGEGLMAAGTGLLNIGLGLDSMTGGLTALIAMMPVFIDSLVGITDNIGGIILFVLLAAAVFLMAEALQKMNEPFGVFKDNLTAVVALMSVGFVAAFAVFAVLMVGMSLFMAKVATGLQKVTDAMTKQCAKLAVLNPLMATYAVLSNPFVGAVTVALAIASGLLVKALLPAMATGGVVSAPTVAMVGEGKYPEAVVPLGDSPQFGAMKADIANAVLQGLAAMNGFGRGAGAAPTEVVLNLDGTRLARAILPSIGQEQRRKGYSVAIREE